VEAPEDDPEVPPLDEPLPEEPLPDDPPLDEPLLLPDELLDPSDPPGFPESLEHAATTAATATTAPKPARGAFLMVTFRSAALPAM
jgi:hypothetical protein